LLITVHFWQALSEALVKESARAEAGLRRSLEDMDHMAAMCSRVEVLTPAMAYIRQSRPDFGIYKTVMVIIAYIRQSRSYSGLGFEINGIRTV